MKTLFINLLYHGHVTPTKGLVRELIKQGCEVTIISQATGARPKSAILLMLS